jgi:hypothetical protein
MKRYDEYLAAKGDGKELKCMEREKPAFFVVRPFLGPGLTISGTQI